MLARGSGIVVDQPWYLVSKANLALDLVWSYALHFCCNQLFRKQKSGVFPLDNCDLCESDCDGMACFES